LNEDEEWRMMMNDPKEMMNLNYLDALLPDLEIIPDTFSPTLKTTLGFRN
jgi:hypothetical protein